MARPRSEEARQRVIEATISSLLDVGAEGTTVEEIARRSGVAKSTIYRHYQSREEIFADAVRARIVEYPTPDTGSLAKDLEVLFSRYDEDKNQEVNELYPLLLDAARRDPSIRKTVADLLAERQRPLRTVLKLAQLRKEIDPDLDMDVAMAMLLGPLNYRRIVQDIDITDDFVQTALAGSVAALRSTAPNQE